MDERPTDEIYEELRPLLFSIAYRMVGRVSEAEDIVQEAFLRYHRAETEDEEIDSPKAFLSTVTTRLSIDYLRSARAQREEYVGEWLPEPLLTDPDVDTAQHVETADSLSLAFLVLLESLSPVERAVFLLHDVFGYGYDQVSDVVSKSEDNTRQLAVRARRHVDERRPRFEASREERQRLADRFFKAVDEGDTEGLVGLLAHDVVVYGDGGRKGPSWPRPIYGRDNVSRLLLGLRDKWTKVGVTLRRTEINGQPGAMFLDREGRLINIFSLDVAGGVVQTIRSISNPEKLGHLGPLADVRALLREIQDAGRG
jgi:RNA polymerase sigma-70 factor, ECF subfamily